MKHIKCGDGRIKTGTGHIEGRPCLTMVDTKIPRAVGTTSTEGPSKESQNAFDVIISFKNIESARLLQDMLNELVCRWSREESPKVEESPKDDVIDYSSQYPQWFTPSKLKNSMKVIKTCETKIVAEVRHEQLAQYLKDQGVIPKEWDSYSINVEGNGISQGAKVTVCHVEVIT